MSCAIEPGSETIQLFFKSTRKTLRPYYTSQSMLSAAPVRCYLCLSNGHTKTSCPLRYCKACGGVYGHSGKECKGQRTWRSKSLTPPPAPPPIVHRRQEWSRGAKPVVQADDAASTRTTFRPFTHMSHIAAPRDFAFCDLASCDLAPRRSKGYGFQHRGPQSPPNYAKGPSRRIGDGFLSRRLARQRDLSPEQ